MIHKKFLDNLKRFDPELCGILEDSLKRQLNTLSLIPTTNAISPFAAYLKGSTLGNDFLDYHAAEHHSRLEKLAIKRMCSLYGAEHAIVRTGSLVAASRVVMLGLLKSGDTVLSFNRRKEEHCTGDLMQYKFVKFGLEADSLRLNFDKIKKLAQEQRPKMIICSPVNYSYNIDYAELRKIADEVGAYLWIDLGQNSGLVAAKKIPSPVPFADVATFAASDALHGPQNGIILCRKTLAETLDQAVIDTGHVSLKKNVLASIDIALSEATCEEFSDYAKQVLKNARALERGLKKAGCKVLCSPTENHLVLLSIPNEQDGETLAQKLEEAGLLVKPEKLCTADENISFSILRLSSLDATTRSLDEWDMEKIGNNLGEFLRSPQDSAAIKSLQKTIKKLVEHLPLFAEDWLPELETVSDADSHLTMNAMINWRV